MLACSSIQTLQMHLENHCCHMAYLLLLKSVHLTLMKRISSDPQSSNRRIGVPASLVPVSSQQTLVFLFERCLMGGF